MTMRKDVRQQVGAIKLWRNFWYVSKENGFLAYINLSARMHADKQADMRRHMIGGYCTDWQWEWIEYYCNGMRAVSRSGC